MFKVYEVIKSYEETPNLMMDQIVMEESMGLWERYKVEADGIALHFSKDVDRLVETIPPEMDKIMIRCLCYPHKFMNSQWCEVKVFLRDLKTKQATVSRDKDKRERSLEPSGPSKKLRTTNNVEENCLEIPISPSSPLSGLPGMGGSVFSSLMNEFLCDE
jgi:hypothetical protein